MADKDHYDVIIIGSGAGGGTLAGKLAPAGKRVLLLQRGDYLPREKDNWSSRAVALRVGEHLAARSASRQRGRESFVRKGLPTPFL